jgi:hypothetical protein
MRRSRSTPTPKRARALSTRELAHITGGVWVAYTDDGTTLASVWVAQTDDGATLLDGNGGLANWAMTDRGDT